jgi:hypothetical protein
VYWEPLERWGTSGWDLLGYFNNGMLEQLYGRSDGHCHKHDKGRNSQKNACFISTLLLICTNIWRCKDLWQKPSCHAPRKSHSQPKDHDSVTRDDPQLSLIDDPDHIPFLRAREQFQRHPLLAIRELRKRLNGLQRRAERGAPVLIRDHQGRIPDSNQCSV